MSHYYFENYHCYYPISYEIADGQLTGIAETYNRGGEEFFLSVSCPPTRAGFREMSRILRAWLHGRIVCIQGETLQLSDVDAVFDKPLTGDLESVS